MILNYIWVALFAIGFFLGVFKLCMGDVSVFPAMMDSTFDTATQGYEMALGLTGVLTLWMGIMKVGEAGGAVGFLSKLLSPVLTKLFPEIPKGHPVFGSIFMNISANMLGLDNAATPTGLKAMTGLQELNKNKEAASNSMIMFLTLNTSGLTIIPVSIMAYRAQAGAADPSDIFIPVLLTTFIATLVGILVVSMFQRINLFKRSLLIALFIICSLVAALFYAIHGKTPEEMQVFCKLLTSILLMSIILTFIFVGVKQKINVYDAFIEGAKDGFSTAIRIIPYLVAILVAVGVFKASGAMQSLTNGLTWLTDTCGISSDFVGGIPTALMKPLSGGGSRGMMIEAMNSYGADSFVGHLVCMLQGSTDTTFYILALYFGSVGIRKTRHAVACGLLADLAGTIAGIILCYFFFA